VLTMGACHDRQFSGVCPFVIAPHHREPGR
jgi:hypothetical protein